MSTPFASFLRKHKHKTLNKTPLRQIYRTQAMKISYFQKYIETKYIHIDAEVPPIGIHGDEESIEIISEFLVDYSIALMVMAGLMYYVFRDPIPGYLRKAESRVQGLEEIVERINKKNENKGA